MLSGGEIPALALLDAVARLQPGVLGDVRSHEQDSFSAGLLDCPHYSRPEVLADGGEGAAVPPVLLSGNHAAIERWRRDQALALTAERRPDLVAAAEAAGRLERGRPGRPRSSQGGKAIILGFPILCHGGAHELPHTFKSVRTIT